MGGKVGITQTQCEERLADLIGSERPRRIFRRQRASHVTVPNHNGEPATESALHTSVRADPGFRLSHKFR